MALHLFTAVTLFVIRIALPPSFVFVEWTDTFWPSKFNQAGDDDNIVILCVLPFLGRSLIGHRGLRRKASGQDGRSQCE